MHQHACIHAAALCILYQSSTHAMEAHIPPHMLEHACTPNRHACALTSVGLSINPGTIRCVFASMQQEQRKARAWGLFVDHPGYCHTRWSLLVHCAKCAGTGIPRHGWGLPPAPSHSALTFSKFFLLTNPILLQPSTHTYIACAVPIMV